MHTGCPKSFYLSRKLILNSKEMYIICLCNTYAFDRLLAQMWHMETRH